MEEKHDFVECPKCYWPSPSEAAHCEVCGCPLSQEARQKASGGGLVRAQENSDDGFVLVRSREKLEDPRRQDRDNPWRHVEPLRVGSNSNAPSPASRSQEREFTEEIDVSKRHVAAPGTVEVPPQEDTSEKLQTLLRDIFDETGPEAQEPPKKAQDFRNESDEIEIEDLFGEDEALIACDDVQDDIPSSTELRLPTMETADPPWSRKPSHHVGRPSSHPIQQELPLGAAQSRYHTETPMETERVRVVTAAARDRVWAGLFDLTMTTALFVVMSWAGFRFFAGSLLGSAFGEDPVSSFTAASADPWMLASMAVLYLTVVFVYLVFFTATCGETPGQTVLGIRTVRRNTEPAGLICSTKRTLGLIFGLAAGGFSLLGLYKDKQGQSPHDRWADTMVMRRELSTAKHRTIEELA